MTGSPHDHDYDGMIAHTPLCCVAKTKFEEMDRRVEQKFEELEKRVGQKFDDMNLRLDQQFEMAQEAITKAEHLMTIRLEGMNQFRQQILDERASFATRRESVMVTFIISLILVVVGLVFAHLVGGKP